MTSHFLTPLRKVYVACDDNSSKFFDLLLKEKSKFFFSYFAYL